MPAVPYSGAASVVPSLEPGIPYQNDRGATPDAFGAQVGQAEIAQGKALEQFGDVLQRHAEKRQDDANKAWANEAFVNGTMEAGELKTKLMTLEGQAAADFYKNEYVPKIKGIADKYANDAPNGEARKFFQQDFRRRLGFDIENGAGYAAGQQKKQQSATADAVVQTSVSDAAKTGASDKEFEFNRGITKKAVKDKAQLHNWNEEQETEALNKADSALWGSRIESIALTDPFRAKEIYDKNKDSIDGDMQVKIEKHLQQQFNSVGTRIDADDIAAGRTARQLPAPLNGAKGITAGEPLTPDSPTSWLASGIEMAKEVARARQPDNPKYEDDLVNRVKTEYNNVMTIKNEAERANYNAVLGATLGTTRNGTPIKSMDEIYNDQALNSAYYALPPARQKAIDSQVLQNAKRDVPLTPGRYNAYIAMKGLATTDKQAFADADLAALDLPAKQKGELLLMQGKIKESGQKELQVNRVLSYVRPQLQAAGVGPSSSDTVKAGQYNLFVGAFQDQIANFEQEKKRLPTEKETQEITSKLLVEQNSDSWFSKNVYTQSRGRLFEVTVPEQESVRIKNFLEKKGENPTPERIRRFYIDTKLYNGPR